MLRVICVLVSATAAALAQYATIQGAVTDQSQAVMPGVRIVATSTATGVTRTAVTNSRGFYSIPLLSPGTYSIEASAEQFAPLKREGLKLDVNSVAQVDFTLKLGALAESMLVSDTAALMESGTTAIGQVMENRRIVDLPLNGRNYLELARLAAVVAPDYGSRTNASGTFSAVGQRAYQTNILIDGIDNNSRAGGGQLGWEAQAVTPSIDSVAEFRLVTNNNSAEYGFRMGGTVIVQTKAGTNELHGSLYEFLRNDRLDAANYFAVGQPKPAHRRNQFGGSVGGPLVHERTFGFFSYEATRLRERRTAISTVPSTDIREGDFPGGRAVFDPASTRFSGGKWIRDPFADNRIPETRIDAVAARVAALYPEPNLPGTASNYFYAGPASGDSNQLDGRADHVFSDTQRAFLRYSRRTYSSVDPGPLPLPADGGRWSTTDLTGNSVAANWTATLSTAVNNELRFGITALHTMLGNGSDENYNRIVGMRVPTGVDGEVVTGMTRFSATGYAQIGTRTYRPTRDDLDVMHGGDTLMLVRGTHLVKVGFEFRRESMYGIGGRFSRGFLVFNRSFTQDPGNRGASGDGMADLLLGLASSATIGNESYETPTALNYSGFVQDDWRIARKLTLNLGLRWDRFGPPSFGDSPVSRFELRPGSSEYLIVRPGGPSDCGCQHDNRNFAPRIGLAYEVTSRTVLRTGFGVFYGEPDSIYHDGDARFNNMPPEFTEVTFSSDRLIAPALVVAQGFPIELLPAADVLKGSAVMTANAYMPSQYSMQWFADVQRELPLGAVLTMSYIGAGTRHMSITRELNQPLTPGPGALQQRRPWPFFSEIRFRDPSGNASYHAFAAKAEKRYARGLTFLGTYTWSHNIDNGAGTLNDGMVPGDDAAGGIRDNYDLRSHRGNSSYDVRHNFTAAFVYDVPFGRGRRWRLSGPADWLLGGWQVAGMLAFRSGQPFSVTVSSDISNTGTSNYPDRIASGVLPAGQGTIDRWFDTAAFAIAPAYTYGDSGRNILTGPGFRSADVKIGKSVGISERTRLESRFEMFNATNTPHFSLPAAAIDIAGAGQIRSAGDPRRVQLGLKLTF